MRTQRAAVPPLARRRVPRAVRLFRILLAIYPGEFRDEYGREMALVFADRHRAASTTAERLLVWIEALWGVLTQAPKEHVEMLLQDLRYATRALRKDKTFTLAVLLTLALGIGANTAVFELIDAIRLRHLPVQSPGELAEVRIVGGNRGFGVSNGPYAQLTRPLWYTLREHQQAFSGAFSWAMLRARVGESPDLRIVSTLYVSGDFFGTLGVPPAQGRLLGAADTDTPCPASSAVVSHAYWQRAFGGRELRPTDRLRVNGQAMQIVGVTPASFTGLAVGDAFDIVLPACLPGGSGAELRREIFDVSVIGRLKSGWTHERASAHLGALSRGLFEATVPTGYGAKGTEQYKSYRLAAYPVASGVSSLRQRFDRPLLLLLGMTGLVLLLAGANLANLFLARASARDAEVAIRLALGGSRPALARQFLTECALLAGGGALIGIAVAQGLSRVLVWALVTDEQAPVLTLELSWTVLGFTASVTVLTCVLFGLAPVVRASRIRATGAMRAQVRGATRDRGRARTQRAMVVAQLAISLVLMVAALLFVRSFHRLMTFDPGVRRSGVTVAIVAFDTMKLAPEAYNDYQRRLVADVKAVPGVVDAGTTTNIPLLGATWGHGITVDGVEDGANVTWVGPGYFNALGVPIVQGRSLTLQDTRTSRRVAVVNQAFARTFTGGLNPIGRQLRTHPEPKYPATTYEIVGVVPDTKYHSLRADTPPMVFAPDSQLPDIGPWAVIMIHSTLPPGNVMQEVGRALRGRHPQVVVQTFDFERRVRDGLVGERLLAMLTGFFGGLAAIIAMVGIYGVVSYGISQRRQEFGVRTALGATRAGLVRQVMREAGRLVLFGLALGGIGAWLATRQASTLFFELSPHDPVTLGTAAALLAAIAAIASYVPARRAARIDPVTALRQD